MKHIFIALTFFLALVSVAQAEDPKMGLLRGTVIDDYFGDPVMYAEVSVEGLDVSTLTDLDGQYSFELAPGTYTLSVEFLGYAKQVVSEVVVKEGGTELVDVRLTEESEVITEVVVTATQSRNNETALLTIQRKSAVVLDGVSAQSISRIGDSDAGQAIQRVSGVSVEGGKYIYVRGLGDRYTKTTLNGMDIPGLDPDRNTVQMNVFPTSLIDNIIVRKTFAPNMPGDFSGGVVDIATKSFPDKEQFNVKFGLGYNTNTSFNKNFLTYNGGKLDWLGIDDGGRDLPSGYDYTDINGYPTAIQEIQEDPSIEAFTREFNPTLGVRSTPAFLNTSLSTSYGNQYQLGESNQTLGLIAGFSYQNNNQHFEVARYGEYFKSRDANSFDLDDEQYRSSLGPLSQNNVLWSGLVGFALKGQKHRLNTQLFHTQNGEKSASTRYQLDGWDDQESEFTTLTYSQRSITNLLVGGKSTFNRLELEYKNALTWSEIIDPDLRTTSLEVTGGAIPALSGGGGSGSDRLWRDLSEFNETFRMDGTYLFSQWDGLESKFQFGVSNTYKVRDFVTTRAEHIYQGLIPNGDPNTILSDDLIWTAGTPLSDTTTIIRALREKQNSYNGRINVLGAYLMNELPLGRRMRVIYGVRMEKASNWYTGEPSQPQFAPIPYYDDEKVLNELNFLPSVNWIYELASNMNLRASFSRTVVRPSFKEISLAEIFDPLTETTFIGNIDVKQTDIDNFDLRWESFFGRGEMISLSGFYKRFTNPIELVSVSEFGPREITPRNVDEAFLLGAEIELRKNFAFIHPALENLAFTGNASYIKSQTSYTDAEYATLLANAKPGEDISRERVMFGQSPFLVNVGLGYRDTEKGFDAIVSYNVQGKRLVLLGIDRVPNVYEQPFNNLKVKIAQSFGEDDRFMLSVSASNLLNDDRARQYEVFQGDPGVFSQTRAGRTFKLSFAYTLQ